MTSHHAENGVVALDRELLDQGVKQGVLAPRALGPVLPWKAVEVATWGIVALLTKPSMLGAP